MRDIHTTMGYLDGHLLVAMPAMQDPRFERSVIYMCAHTAEGAMGLVINKVLDTLTFPELLKQIGIDLEPVEQQIRVHFGGPVESGRGFVLHSTDYAHDGTLMVDEGFALTASIDILKAIADGTGPNDRLLMLGYAGWAPGQLESEIQANGWLHVKPDPALVFDKDLDGKWERAMAKLGIDLHMLSGNAGHA